MASAPTINDIIMASTQQTTFNARHQAYETQIKGL
jgi:hypothetical protein